MDRSIERVLVRTPEIEIDGIPDDSSTISISSMHPSFSSQYSVPAPSYNRRLPPRLPSLPIEKRKTVRLQRMERPAGRPSTAKSTTSRQSTTDSLLMRSADSVELNMLKSITRLRLGSRQATRSFDDSLREHEYEDLSDEETHEKRQQNPGRGTQSAHPHPRLTKQKELDGTPQAIRRRAHSAHSQGGTDGRHIIREMEDRLQGFRHEKTSSTQRSQKSTDFSSDAMAGLIYDADFDCYYNPEDDTYYRVTTES
ncbi:unnamed protein product, partial [Mesorhabditis spiculigera]